MCVLLFIAAIWWSYHLVSIETDDSHLHEEIMSCLVYLGKGEVIQMQCDFH
jgi:hypothetical protein